MKKVIEMENIIVCIDYDKDSHVFRMKILGVLKEEFKDMLTPPTLFKMGEILPDMSKLLQ